MCCSTDSTFIEKNLKPKTVEMEQTEFLERVQHEAEMAKRNAREKAQAEEKRQAAEVAAQEIKFKFQIHRLKISQSRPISHL